MTMLYDLDSEGGMNVIGDGGEDSAGTVVIKGGAASTPALVVGRTVAGAATIAALRIAGTSAASAALLGFMGGFISCTSIDIITAANSDYVIPVSVGGVIRYIPLVNSTAIKGGAAF